MATYNPLFMYVSPASVPQIVANIQKYLADNPIVSDPEAIAEAIADYIADHPEIIAVASVNGKTGNVVLTGSDININASSAVTIETQLLNLASMIASAGSNISQIQAQLETIYTNINTLDGKVTANETAIDNLEASVTGHGTRIAAAETNIDDLEAAQSSQNTRLNAAEGNISNLQTRMAQAETDIDNNESSIGTLNANVGTLQNSITNLTNKTIISASLGGGQAPTLVANSYVKGASITLSEGLYVIKAEATYEPSSGTTRSMAIRIGTNYDAGAFNLFDSMSTGWQHLSLCTMVYVQGTSEYSVYMYSTLSSSNKCASEIAAVKIN